MDPMDKIKQEQNRGYVIAGGAAIIAFIAFFLPYITASGVLVNGGSVTANGATVGSWLWLEFLGVLVVIAVSAVFVFRNNLLSGTINMPLGQQIKYGKYLLLGGSVLAILIHLFFLLSYSASGAADAYSGLGVSVSLGFGFWLFMLAVIAMTVGSVMAIRAPVAAVASAYGQQYPPQSAPYPPQSTPYSPYQQSYPPTDQQPQQPYDPYQQPQQQPYQPYPPAQQQSQQPYDPYQQPQQPQQYPPTEMQPPPQQ